MSPLELQRDIPHRVIITSDGWKLNLAVGDFCELYNLNDDPHETTNLFYDEQHGEIAVELARRIRAWQERNDDRLALPDIYPGGLRFGDAVLSGRVAVSGRVRTSFTTCGYSVLGGAGSGVSWTILSVINRVSFAKHDYEFNRRQNDSHVSKREFRTELRHLATESRLG